MLRQIRQLAVAREDADKALRAAVAEASAAGESVSALAEAAGVTRQTIYRWIATENGDAQGSRESITEAMLMMATHMQPHQAQQIRNRAYAADVQVLLRGLEMARSWVPPYAELTDEDRACLLLAADAENRLRRGLSKG